MKKKELKLMSVLRDNARLPLTKVSKATRIPVSTIFDTLKALQEETIAKFTCLVDFRKLGFDVRIHLFFKVPYEKREKFHSFLLKHPRINTAYRINNGYDYFVEAVFKDLREYHNFIDSLEEYSVEEQREHFILEDVKREDFLTEKHMYSMKT